MGISSQIIEALLRETDIEGFIEVGAPADEYDSEAEALIVALSELSQDEITEENVSAILSEIWMQSFNLGEAEIGLRRAAIQSLASRIVQSHAASS